jgi:predicted chitinase
VISKEQMKRAMPLTPMVTIERYLPFLLATMEEFEINTKPRAAAFLAQLAHETAGFIYMEEIANGAAYDNRADLGNTTKQARAIATRFKTTTGRLFKGRGAIQITGFYNYFKCGEYFKADLINNPRVVARNEWAFRVSGWFWIVNNLNALADLGEFDKITRRINGGFNGKTSRDSFYAAFKRVLA